MSFSDDIKKFTSQTTSILEDMQIEQKEKITEFLKKTLGGEFKNLISYEFDNDNKKFFNVKASESVIKKLQEAGCLRK